MKKQDFCYFYEQNFRVEHQRVGKSGKLPSDQSHNAAQLSGLKNSKTNAGGQLRGRFEKNKTKN